MLGQGIPGALVSYGASANAPGGAAGSGGAGPVSNQTAATYSATIAENGTTYTNAGAVATVEIQLPAGTSIGDVRSIAQTNGGQVIRVKFPGAEIGWVGGTPSSAGGTIATGADGAFISFRKVGAARWQAFGAAGTVGTVT